MKLSRILVATTLILWATLAFAQWDIQIVDQDIPHASVVSSLALDNNGVPHIVYAVYLNPYSGVLLHAQWTGVAWAKDTITPFLGAGSNINPFLVIDPQNGLHVFYRRNTSPSVSPSVYSYAKKTSNQPWTIVDVDTSVYHILDPRQDYNWYGALTLDSLNQPHVAYTLNGTLMHAYYNSGLSHVLLPFSQAA